jgi:hypothetical protein
MDQLGVDVGFLVETKLTGEIYTCFSGGYKVLAPLATLIQQGEIALCWNGNNLYEVEETRFRGLTLFLCI